MCAQHIDKSKESPGCRQDQGIAQDESDGRAADERGCDTSKLGAEHGPDDHEEDRDYVHVTAHVLPQRPITSGNHYLQKVRAHCDMSRGANTVNQGRDSNEASAYAEEPGKHSGTDADKDDHPHGDDQPRRMTPNDGPQFNALKEKR